MSQPNYNYPSFSFSEPYYHSDSSQPVRNASFTRWNPPDSRSMGHAAPSPSPSVRTVRSAPNPRPSNVTGTGYGQSSVLQRDGAIDSNVSSSLSFLQVPQSARPRSSLDNANPIARFYSEDSPWSSERMRNPHISFSHPSFPQPNVDYRTYRDGPGSEIESLAPRSDSGYQTMPPLSLLGNDPDRVDHEIPSEVTYQVRHMNVSSASSEAVDVFRITSSVTDQASQYSGRSAARSTGGKEIRCPECKEVSKCKSDHKKHMLRHKKPFKCHIPNCRRGGKGFTTINDLNRHKKSVHRIRALENSYKCASENCRNRDKIWPRLDNFKQHIHRMHKGEDEHDLIRRSAYQPPEPSPLAESLSVAPMDTTLAGIGTERQLSNPSNELDDPVPGISLTPDQESNQWSSFDPSTHEFAMDVDQTNTNLFGRDSRNTNMASTHKPRGQGQSATSNANSATAVLGRRASFERLDALADAASSQAPPDIPTPQVPPQLSTAPQTKADQQRLALQKFSKILVRDIRNASSTDAGDLESVITRVLFNTLSKRDNRSSRQPQGQTQSHGTHGNQHADVDIESDTLTKKEALKATQAMSNLIKRAPNAQHRRSSSFPTNMKKCDHCPVTVARDCDMRKHMKRHTRPFGCTYPKCHKRFGAKSDWKRHENSQHFQLESFRCQLTSPSSQTPCGELFYRAEIFKNHLTEEHGMSQAEKVEHEVRMRRIGKNGQGQFWCGFCQKIIRLEKQRNAAWDERFDHIGNHFKEGKKIGEWLCVEAKKTKAEVLKEVDKYAFGDEAMDVSSPDDEVVDTEEQHQVHQGQSPIPSASTPSSETRPSTSSSRKRMADTEQPDEPVQKRNKHETWRYCCTCESGPYATHTYLSCMDCNHQWCSNCRATVARLE